MILTAKEEKVSTYSFWIKIEQVKQKLDFQARMGLIKIVATQTLRWFLFSIISVPNKPRVFCDRKWKCVRKAESNASLRVEYFQGNFTN